MVGFGEADEIQELEAEIIKLKEQLLKPCITCDAFVRNDKLKAFARYILDETCDVFQIDTDLVQEKAEELDLIKEGDEGWRYTQILEE